MTNTDNSQESMQWPHIALRASSPFEAELIETGLEGAGALAVTLTDAADVPIFEPLPGETPLWQDTVVTGLFEPDSDWSTILKQLHDTLPFALMETAETSQVPDQDWIRVWMDQFKPMQFGDNTWIVPTHCEPLYPNAVNVMLDPGLAFGTGTHPTTDLCLQWLDKNAPLSGQRVLDYGTGSGILAIAAGLHGATEIDAVDIDPQSLTATKENAERNRVTCISTYLPDAYATEHQATTYPLVLANILAQPLIELAPMLSEHTELGGHIVLAGLTNNQVDIVWQAYEPYFEAREVKEKDGWSRISATRKS